MDENCLFDIEHSQMYLEGQDNAKNCTPYNCPYLPGSEAEEDFRLGYQDYFKGRGGDAEGEFALI